MSYCKDKVAVVTGAGGTLCSAIAIDLAKKGAKVVLVGRTREKLEKVENEIAASGGVCGQQQRGECGNDACDVELDDSGCG